MAARKWPERSQYKKFKWSFDYFWRQNGKKSFYHKDPDLWFASLPFDSQLLYKWTYYWIEYKACTNKSKFTFSAMKDLDKELRNLFRVEASWGKSWIIVIFPEAKVTKFFSTNFVMGAWDQQLTIADHWTVLPEIKDDLNRKIYDVEKLII